MRSPHNEKAQVFAGPGPSRNADEWCNPLLAKFRRQVNEIRIGALRFGGDLLLAGLACLGWPWSRRLSLWMDWIDYRAEELRERQGERA